jgi:hypothetical protein
MTTDIDAAVRGDRIDVAALVKALAKKQIIPRIDDAEQFASESLVLLLKHEPTGVEFDVSLAWTDFEHAAIAASSVTAFGAVKAPMARPEDLVVFKAIAARPKDIEDATALLVLYPKIDRARLRDRVRELAMLAEQPDLVRGLETAITTSTAKPGRATAPASSVAKAKPGSIEPAKARPAKARPAKARPAKARPAKARPAKARPAKARPAKARPAKARSAVGAGPARAKPKKRW